MSRKYVTFMARTNGRRMRCARSRRPATARYGGVCPPSPRSVPSGESDRPPESPPSRGSRNGSLTLRVERRRRPRWSRRVARAAVRSKPQVPGSSEVSRKWESCSPEPVLAHLSVERGQCVDLAGAISELVRRIEVRIATSPPEPPCGIDNERVPDASSEDRRTVCAVIHLGRPRPFLRMRCHEGLDLSDELREELSPVRSRRIESLRNGPAEHWFSRRGKDP